MIINESGSTTPSYDDQQPPETCVLGFILFLFIGAAMFINFMRE